MAVNTRELVLDTLLALERGEDFSHRLVKGVLDKYDYLDPREKAFIKRLTEGTLERQIELDYHLDRFSRTPVKKMRPLIRCLMRMSVYQLLYMDAVPPSAVCNEACRLAQKRGFTSLKGFVNGTLRAVSRGRDSLVFPDEALCPVEHLSVKYSMPPWLVELWAEEYGLEITAKLLRELLAVHPVSLRFSTCLTKQERQEALERMKARGMRLSQSPFLPWIYLAEGAENLGNLPEFAQGLCTVQDVGSALAVEAARIREGDFVVDVCAAPGGKSILAGERAGGGRVLARDLTEEKRALVQENIRRMGALNIETEVFDGTCTDTGLLGKADVVLLDVPCSGLGVAGKKRDIKYRVKKQDLEELMALQRRILRASAGYVKPGGTLLYSTCTIHRGENQEMVRFLVRELGFEPLPLGEVLPEAVLARGRLLEEDLCRAGLASGQGLTEEEKSACLQLLPGYMEADGFFMARLRRKDC